MLNDLWVYSVRYIRIQLRGIHLKADCISTNQIQIKILVISFYINF